MTLQPTLKRHQQQKQPDYIQEIARQKLEADGVIIEPELKRRRSQEVIPLSKPSLGVSKLPELPDDLKYKQVCGPRYYVVRRTEDICVLIDFQVNSLFDRCRNINDSDASITLSVYNNTATFKRQHQYSLLIMIQ